MVIETLKKSEKTYPITLKRNDLLILSVYIFEIFQRKCSTLS